MPISVMLKPASGNCNLRCEYCFYHDLAATRQTENKGYMTRDTALQVMDKALAFAGDGPVYFTFQGGEPLLAGKDFFRFFFSSCKERQRPGVTVQFCVQTNGTLLCGAAARQRARSRLFRRGDRGRHAHHPHREGGHRL